MGTSIRTPRSANAAALLACVFLAGLLVGPAALAQQGGGAAQRAPAQSAKRVMWWNHTNLVVRLKLTAEQRTKMDQVYSWHEESRSGPAPGRLRQEFLAALTTGDWKASERALATWAEGEASSARKQGELKIGVLSLLSEEQMAILSEGSANLIRSQWRPKINWPVRNGQQRPGQAGRPQ
jgi:Spy/CpxP family protein refolding chaperone